MCEWPDKEDEPRRAVGRAVSLSRYSPQETRREERGKGGGKKREAEGRGDGRKEERPEEHRPLQALYSFWTFYHSLHNRPLNWMLPFRSLICGSGVVQRCIRVGGRHD